MTAMAHACRTVNEHECALAVPLDAFAGPFVKDRSLREGDVSFRRKARVADRGLGRLNWAESDAWPNGGNRRDSGRTNPEFVGAETARSTLPIISTTHSKK